MAYDEAQYTKASADLTSAIETLKECDISRDDIEEMVEDRLSDAFEE